MVLLLIYTTKAYNCLACLTPIPGVQSFRNIEQTDVKVGSGFMTLVDPSRTEFVDILKTWKFLYILKKSEFVYIKISKIVYILNITENCWWVCYIAINHDNIKIRTQNEAELFSQVNQTIRPGCLQYLWNFSNLNKSSFQHFVFCQSIVHCGVSQPLFLNPLFLLSPWLLSKLAQGRKLTKCWKTFNVTKMFYKANQPKTIKSTECKVLGPGPRS